MPYWLQILLALVALLVLAPLVAWLGKRHGRSVRGSIALASLLLGLGQPIDPPPTHRVESAGPGKDQAVPGEPPLES